MTAIYNTYTLFTSGAITSGTSATNIVDVLSFDTKIAYSLGPPTNVYNFTSSVVGIRGTTSASLVVRNSWANQQGMSYIWRTFFDPTYQTVHLERSVNDINSSFGGWQTMASTSASFINTVNSIDLALDNYGRFFITMEIPALTKLTNDHYTDIVIATNLPLMAGLTQEYSIVTTGSVYQLRDEYPNKDIFTVSGTNSIGKYAIAPSFRDNTNTYEQNMKNSSSFSIVDPRISPDGPYVHVRLQMFIIPNASSPKVLWDGLT